LGRKGDQGKKSSTSNLPKGGLPEKKSYFLYRETATQLQRKTEKERTFNYGGSKKEGCLFFLFLRKTFEEITSITTSPASNLFLHNKRGLSLRTKGVILS